VKMRTRMARFAPEDQDIPNRSCTTVCHGARATDRGSLPPCRAR
jgi:hypothetical protein